MKIKPKFFLLTTVSMSLDFFREQLKNLNKDFEVCIISCPSQQLNDIGKREGVRSIGIEMKREIAVFSDIKSLWKLIFLFLKEKPKIVHCNTPKASLLGLIAAWLTRVPKRIYYIHGLRYEGTKGSKRKLLVMMEKISCFCANKIIAVSYGVKQITEKELTSKKVDIIHNGSANGMMVEEFLNADYDVVSIKRNLNINLDDFVYGFVGRIVSDKGINELVQAFLQINKKIKSTKLLLVGMYEDDLDPLTDFTKKIILDNPNIIEIGFQKDVKKYLSIFDVFVSPSYREGFGLSLLEANLMGVPVIATNITGYTEIVKEGINGFLVEKKDIKQLYIKMLEVFDNRFSLKNMNFECKNIVIQNFNHKNVLSKSLEYYINLK